jgi:hypothetical protein
MTYFCDDFLQTFIPCMNLEYLTLPSSFVVGQSPDDLDVELVAMFTCLARTIFPPSKIYNA